MLRTQIYLPQSQIKALKEEAAKKNTSVSEVVREALEENLFGSKKDKDKSKYNNAGTELLAMARQAKKMKVKGPKDLATNMDKYLYDKDFR